MKKCLIDYSLSVSFFILFVICWLMRYLTSPGEAWDNRFWNNAFIKWEDNYLRFFCFIVIVTYLLRKGFKDCTTNLNNKLDRIIQNQNRYM